MKANRQSYDRIVSVRHLVAIALSLVAPAIGAIFEQLAGLPAGWTCIGRAPPDWRVRFGIMLKQPDEDLFEETILDVATPHYHQYRKYLSQNAVQELVEPSREGVDTVSRWLEGSGIPTTDVQVAGAWIYFTTTILRASDLMQTQFDLYRRDDSRASRVGTLSYSVPLEVQPHVDLIYPTIQFSNVGAQISRFHNVQVLGPVGEGFNVSDCNTTMTPACIRALYNIHDAVNGADKPTGFMGVAGFLEQTARFADYDTFKQEYDSSSSNGSFDIAQVEGGSINQKSLDDSSEANLDVQYSGSVSGLPITFYSTAGRGPLVPDLDEPDRLNNSNEPWLEFLLYMLNLPDEKTPHTLSISYGENEQSLPSSYTKLVCNLFGMLGARGVSIIVSSGDTGVGYACQSNDGTNSTRFSPAFPASCPYVTSVGGTHQIEPEVAIDFSSGGFSDRFARPDWQSAAVKRYLRKLGSRWDGLYNRLGRGMPDVAAQAGRFHVVDRGLDLLVGGTSAACPTFAAIVARLNAALIAEGKPPLGWLNPWLYSDGYRGLTDIVDGGSTGCVGLDGYSKLTGPYVPYASWNATDGWDPVTGLGTPDFQKLLALARGRCNLSSYRSM